MSGLSLRLNQDMKAAMKARDKFTLSVLRMLRSEIQYAEIAASSSLDDEQVLELLAREAKKRRDAEVEFTKAGRQQTADNLRLELEIISRYLPEPLNQEELTKLVTETIADLGASSPGDIGKVMAAVMAQVKGRAEGREVSRIARELLK